MAFIPNNRHYQAGIALAVLCFIGAMGSVHAESLFRAGATYHAEAPYTPTSLFTQPKPQHVGDIVTILIDETSQLDTDAELKITRNQNITDNGTSIVNNVVRFFVGKLPLSLERENSISNTLSMPSFNGVDNRNVLGSKAESSRTSTLRDNVTCQVLQVLPNGHLVVQGQKTIQVNKERQDMVVSGIINPYYLDRNNQISSKMIANFQLIQGGRGVISRQQNDGMANKLYQFFN